MSITCLFLQFPLSSFPARCISFLILAGTSLCAIGRRLEDSELSETSRTLQDPSADSGQRCLSKQHNLTTQLQDDTTILLQGGRIKVQRLSEYDVEDLIQDVEATMIPQAYRTSVFPPKMITKAFSEHQPLNKTAASPKHRNATEPMSSPTSLLSTIKSVVVGHKAIGDKITGDAKSAGAKGSMEFGYVILGTMLLLACLTACGLFLTANPLREADADERRILQRTNDMMKQNPAGMAPVTRTGSRTSQSSISLMHSPMGTTATAAQPAPRTHATYTRQEPRFDQPNQSSQPFLGSSSLMMPAPSPLMAAPSPPRPMSSMVPVPQEDLAIGVPSGMPPPLCASLVLPVCEARFGVPMFEIAQLTEEGDLGIVGLSGNPLLRASVRKVGKRRSLEILMPEAGSWPRASIGPGLSEASRPDDGTLEIRGLKGSYYGRLEMRPNGTCYVTKDGQTVMIIDGDPEGLQLTIKGVGSVPLASMRISSEPFGGVDHVEIRVEPGVDAVLVLACALAVTLLTVTPTTTNI